MNSVKLANAESRAQLFASAIGVEPPEQLLTEDGAPSREVLDFCRVHGASLDYIFCGDLRPLMRSSARSNSAASSETFPADTPILRLFREWQDQYREANDTTKSQDRLDAACARLTELESKILSLPSICAADFAAKLIAYTNYGGFELDSDRKGALIWAEARALVGWAEWQGQLQRNEATAQK